MAWGFLFAGWCLLARGYSEASIVMFLAAFLEAVDEE